MPSDCLKIIESKSKVRQSRAKAVVAKVNSSSSTPAISSDVAELKDMVRALLLDKKNQSSAPAPAPTPAPVKAVKSNYVTCGGTHSYQNCPATSGNVYQDNIQEYVSQAAAANYNQGNTGFCPQMVANQIRPPGFPPGITTRSGVAYQGPTIPTSSKVVKQGTEVTKDQVQTPSSQSIAHVQPSIAQSETLVSEPVVAPVSALMPNMKPSIPYPSRRDNERRRMDECLALVDLGASINLMPLSVWKALSLSKRTPTCMTLELADSSVSKPIGIAKDVKVKVGMFHFPADFVVVDFKPDPRVPLILRSDFLLFEEANAFLGLEDDPDSSKLDPSYYDLEGDILMLEAILNSDPAPSLPDHEQSVPSFKNELRACEAKPIKASVDEPPEVELKDLPPHFEYAFLEGDNKLPVIIAKELGDKEKVALIKVLKSYNPWVSLVHYVPKKGGFTVVKNEENELIPTRLVTRWRGTSTIVSSMVSPGIFKFPLTLVIRKKQRLPALMERSPTVACLSVCAMRRERFKEDIFLGHKISRNGIEVDKAKVDVITKLPHPTTVKGVRSFLGHTGFYRRFIKDFSKISRPMTYLLKKDTPFIFSEDCIKAFQTLKQKLTEAPILIAPNWDLPFELMCDAAILP
nr:hypothetical protein [Tanacetum cinerariifolium]GFA20342.1 hypothetical protein [Tanacetum cinerariifolium]